MKDRRRIRRYAFWLIAPTLIGVMPAAAADDSIDCAVVAGPLEVTGGKLVRPEPSDADCVRAAALESKFLQTDTSDLIIIANTFQLPSSVRALLMPISERSTDRDSDEDLPPPFRLHVLSWMSSDLVITIYETNGFAGPSTEALLADFETLTVCRYVGAETFIGRTLASLRSALLTATAESHEPPTCHLTELTIE
jgi:hypothetical protein